MIRYLFFIIIYLISFLADAKSEHDTIEGKKRAVLLITTYNKITNKPIEEGAGFFSDNSGHFITNRHVLETFLSDTKKYSIRFRTINGKEFKNIEIIKCGNGDGIDLCYGKTSSDEKIYFFDVLPKSPTRTQLIALIGHNSDFFSVKKGSVSAIVTNLSEKYGLKAGDSKNISMIELIGYECPGNSCKGDSGSPVFDRFTGDLVGVYTEGYKDKNTGELFKYAIDSKEVSSFISSTSNFTSIKIPPDSIFQENTMNKLSPDIGHEFDEERKTGKLD